MAAQRIGIYPGTFDPVTNGHVDIIKRAATLVDKLVVAVSINAGKGPIFSVEERAALLKGEISDGKNGLSSSIEVVTFDTLLVQFAEQMGAKVIIRGLRAVSDFEYEFQLAGMNRRLAPGVETLFLTPSDKYLFLSATIVREIAVLGGDITAFVHPLTVERMRAKTGKGAA
jgi:pantetheine-phosphate adenylyltransferase